MTNVELDSEKLKFLMNVFDKMEDLRAANPYDKNLPEIERIFVKHARDSFAFQRLRLTDIQENSIETNIIKQAKEFYNSISHFKRFTSTIQNQLLSDYVQMEHQRRRDNFERFCQCVYQQIEAIVNQLWDSGTLWSTIVYNRKKSFFAKKVYDSYKKSYVTTPFSYGYTVQSEIFKYRSFSPSTTYYSDTDYDAFFVKGKTHNDRSIDFQVKLRSVLFVLYFDEAVIQENYNDLYNSLYDIITIRNTIHRGPTTTSVRQQSIIDRINKNPSFYYHKFYGIFCDFIVISLNSKNINKI